MAQIRFLIIQCDGGYFFHLPEIDPYVSERVKYFKRYTTGKLIIAIKAL